MRAIESEMVAKGFAKSKNPDVLVSIYTKSRERINVRNNNPAFAWGWGWGYNPCVFGYNDVNINQYIEGTLFIDVIDKRSNELVWQGIGSGAMRMKNPQKKEARIKEFVKQILSKYPPEIK